MPIGLALALALLEAEAAMIAWSVGIGAFVYLETRKHARDWVVRSTYWAMVAAWTVSAFHRRSGGRGIHSSRRLIVLQCLRTRPHTSTDSGLTRNLERIAGKICVKGGVFIINSRRSNDSAGRSIWWSLVILILLVAFAQIRKADQDLGRDKASGWALTSLIALLVAVSVLSIRDRGEVPLELSGANLLPLLFGVMVYIDDRSGNGKKTHCWPLQ